ncbi:MAG: DegV family protein [Clostridiales bacterium]|nr:DegV family protein [Clostridiales bacterium]
MAFTLSTDRSCDIFCSDLDNRGIKYISQVYTIDEVPHIDDFDNDGQYKGFYDLIRAGKMPTTSQINIAEHEEFFEKVLSECEGDLLHITLSSGLSSTYQSALTAAANVNEKLGKTRVYVLDSLAATSVQRIVVDEAEKLRDEGLSAAEALEKMNYITKHIAVRFMPTDLMHLKRGGRVSGPSAVIGTALRIKPILCINKEGGLSVVTKKIGVAAGVSYMADFFKQFNAACTKRVYLPCADNQEVAETLKAKILEIRPDCEVIIGWVGPVIGAHTGAGMVGVTFVSDKERDI